MISPIDQEMTLTDEIVCWSSQEKRPRGPHREAHGSVRGQREGWTLAGAFTVVTERRTR